MGAQAIDNTNLIGYCYAGCAISGFTPAVSYTYSGSTVVVTDASTIPSGDTLKRTKVRLVDQFGGEVRGVIDLTVGGINYTSAPTVVITGGGGSGATATAVVTNGSVSAVNITAGGTGYTSAPTISFTGGGGSNAAATATVGSGAVTAITPVASAANVSLSTSSLNTSRPLSLLVTVLTTNHIAADGSAFAIGASGNVMNWDTQQNA